MENINKEQFEFIGVNEKGSEAVLRPSLTYLQDAWRRFKKNKVAVVSAIIVILMLAMSFIGPLMVPYTFDQTEFTNANQPPSAEHWFGTDELGRDMWARQWRGAKVSLSIGFSVALLNGIIGVIIGGVAGYYGGKVDMVIMRVIDVMNAIPSLIFILLTIVVLDRGIFPIIVAMLIAGWLGMARLIRGQILQLKEQEYVLAARTLGAGSMRILFKHLLPNTFGLVIVSLTMSIPGAIFTEAFLSFIGLGVTPPESSWGQLASRGAAMMHSYPFLLFIPVAFICITMLAFNLFGDGLRDALDPKMRK